MAKYKRLGSVTLFDTQNTKENLSALGNPLERLSQVIDFEMFRNALEDVFGNKKKKNNAGAKPYDVVMMFMQCACSIIRFQRRSIISKFPQPIHKYHNYQILYSNRRNQCKYFCFQSHGRTDAVIPHTCIRQWASGHQWFYS